MVAKLKASHVAEELGTAQRDPKVEVKTMVFQLDLSFFSPQPFHFPTNYSGVSHTLS